MNRPLSDDLDEIQRVTDTKYIAMTESLHDCHFWDAAVPVFGWRWSAGDLYYAQLSPAQELGC